MKLQNLFVLLIIAGLVLSACGGTPEPTQAPEPTEAEVAEPTQAPEPTEAEVAEPTKAPEEEPAAGAELRFTYYADGNEADVMQPILDKFMAENPDINVILDVVPYSTIDEQLPVQVETGEGPDLARITNFAAYQGKLLDLRPYMADPSYLENNFAAPVLAAMRTEGDTQGLHGFPDALTVTGPYVNKTLFDQAGIELPGEGTTWEE
ncbi:MAG: extracellular solute-binding protein, partial [Anaerolineae bacterium]